MHVIVIFYIVRFYNIKKNHKILYILNKIIFRKFKDYKNKAQQTKQSMLKSPIANQQKKKRSKQKLKSETGNHYSSKFLFFKCSRTHYKPLANKWEVRCLNMKHLQVNGSSIDHYKGKDKVCGCGGDGWMSLLTSNQIDWVLNGLARGSRVKSFKKFYGIISLF